MIYTIGLAAVYDKVLATNPEVKKTGREGDYPGGWVWKTRAEAEKRAAALHGYVVYGVLADWDKDTVPAAEDAWNHLLVDSPLVSLYPTAAVDDLMI